MKHVRKKKLVLALSAAACAFSAGFLIARNTLADFNRAFTISQAAGVYITPRGQDYFARNKLMGLLERNGVQLAHGHLASWQYDSEKPFDLGHLPDGLRAYQGTLNFLRGTLRDWLIGFNFNNPLFHVKVREAGYDLDGLDIGLKVDEALTATLGGHGIGVVIEATIPHLRVYAQDICGYDSNNAFLGTCNPNKKNPRRYNSGFGVYNPSVELNDSRPLKLTVPARVEILANGSIQLEALSASTNLDQLKYVTRQDRDLVLPYVELDVGSRKMPVNPGPLVTELMQREKDLVALGIHHLQDFVVKELPARLSGMAFDRLTQTFDTYKEIDPPGIDAFKDGKKFEWGLRPNRLSLLGNGDVFINLAGFVADPEMTWDEHLPAVPPGLPPVLGGRGAGDYDVALVINDFVIQRVLFLAYSRGNLQPVDITDADDHCKVKQQGTIAQSPLIGAGTGNFAKLGVRLNIPRNGSVKEWWALKDPFQVILDLAVRAEKSSDPAHPNSFDLYLDHVNVDNSAVDARYIDHSEESVQKTFRATLRDTRCGSLARKLTDSPIDAPTDLFGIPLRLEQAEFDPHGYLVLYMSYGDRTP